MDQDKKVSSKTFKFFEWLFALVVTNLITIFLIVPIFTAFSAITTLIEVLKDLGLSEFFTKLHNQTNIIDILD